MRGAILWLRREHFGRTAAQARGAKAWWVAQEARDLFLRLTLEENLTVASRPAAGPEGCNELFPRLAERRSNMGNSSRRRAADAPIARALMTNPALLLLDSRSRASHHHREELRGRSGA